MEPTTEGRLASLETKIDAMYASVEKLRKYFQWTMIISVALFVLPLLGVVAVIPSFLHTYTSSLQGIAP